MKNQIVLRHNVTRQCEEERFDKVGSELSVENEINSGLTQSITQIYLVLQ